MKAIHPQLIKYLINKKIENSSKFINLLTTIRWEEEGTYKIKQGFSALVLLAIKPALL